MTVEDAGSTRIIAPEYCRVTMGLMETKKTYKYIAITYKESKLKYRPL